MRNHNKNNSIRNNIIDNDNMDDSLIDLANILKEYNPFHNDSCYYLDMNPYLNKNGNENNADDYALIPEMNSPENFSCDNVSVIANELNDCGYLLNQCLPFPDGDSFNLSYCFKDDVLADGCNGDVIDKKVDVEPKNIINNNKKIIKFVVYKINDKKKKKKTKTSEVIIDNIENINYKKSTLIVNLPHNVTVNKETHKVTKYFQIVKYLIDLSGDKKKRNNNNNANLYKDRFQKINNAKNTEYIINLAPPIRQKKKVLIKSFLSHKRKSADKENL